MELVVAGDETWLCSKCLTDERQPTVIVKQVGIGLLERVQRRHEEPHLVELSLAEYLPCQGDVSAMNRVERPTVDAYLHR